MNPRASCRKDTGILLWTRDCKPDRTTERRMLLTSLDKTDIDMQNRHNLGFSERKRSMDKEWSYKQEVTSYADSPSTELFKGGNLRRQPLAKGLTYDLAQIRNDKLVPCLAGKCVDTPKLLRNINRRNIQNPQDEMALRKQGLVKEKLPQQQKCLEIELDEALANSHKMTAERNSLAEQLRVSQEQAKSEQTYLMQRVKDLQATVLKLDEERCDFTSRQSMLEKQILDLEKQIHIYSCKLDTAEEELKKSETECCSLRELKIKSENLLSDTQCKLMSKVRELQNVLERNEQLEQKSDSLFEQLNDMRSGLYNLESLTFQLNQDKETFQEEVEKKDRLIGSLNLKVEKLENAAKSLHEEVSRGKREQDTLQRRQTDTSEQLNALLIEKDAMVQENADLQDDFDNVQLDKLSLQRKVEASSQEVELLQRKLQDYMTESSCSKMMLSSKEEVIENLKFTVKDLETSVKCLQQEVNRGLIELDAIQRKLTDKEKQLNAVVREKEALLKANTDLQGDHYQAKEFRAEGSSQEVGHLQRKLQHCMTESSQMEKLLWSKEDIIEDLELSIVELETSEKSLQQEVSRGNRELEAMQKKLTDQERQLNAVVKEKEALLKANTELQGEFDGIQHDNQKEVIQTLQHKIRELETSVKSLQVALHERNCELDTMRQKFANTEEEINSMGKEKEAMLQANAALQDDLKTIQLDKQALQLKVEGSSQEGLQRKLQECMTESSYLKILLASKDDVMEHLQVTVKELRTKSLQQEASKENGGLDGVERKLREAKENLDTVLKEKEVVLKENAELKGVLTKVQLENQALQYKVETHSQEVKLLEKKLQECTTEIVSTGILLSSKDEVIGRLKLRVEEVEESVKSLQQAVNKGNSELDAVQKKLRHTEKSLDTQVMEKEVMIKEHADLQGHLDKMNLDNQALQRKMDGSNQEVEHLRKTLQDYMTETTHTKILLSSKDDAYERMNLRIQELEALAKSLKQAVSEREEELNAVQKKLTDTEKKLDFSEMEKNAMLQANSLIRIDLDKHRLDNESLQRKVEGSSQEVELLQRKLQDYTTEISQNNFLLSSKEEAIASLQLAVTKLETSAKNLQPEVSRGSSELDAVWRKLADTEQSLVSVIREKDSMLRANTDLRDTLENIKLDNQVLQCKVEGPSQEVELLQKKLRDSVSELSSLNEKLFLKDQVIENLQLTVKELETSVKSLQQSANRAQKEFEFARKRVSNTEEILSALITEKETIQQENLDLRDELYSVHSGNQALQRKMEGSSQEVELLQMELQDFSTDVNILQSWVSSSEAAISRLLKTYDGLEPSVEGLELVQTREDMDLDAVESELKSSDAELDALVLEEEGIQEAVR